MSTPAAARCGPDCPSCAPMLATAAGLRARADAISYFTAQVHALAARQLPAAVGESIPARPSLTVLPGGAA